MTCLETDSEAAQNQTNATEHLTVLTTGMGDQGKADDASAVSEPGDPVSAAAVSSIQVPSSTNEISISLPNSAPSSVVFPVQIGLY